MTRSDMIERDLGKLLATQELILQELKEQRRRISNIEHRVYTWGGGIALISILLPYFGPRLVQALGLS